MKIPLFTQSWHLARRELRTGFRGFGVFLGCLFLGVFAIAAVGSFSAAARQGLLSDARALLGGDLEIRLVYRELSSDQRRFLLGRGQVSEIVEMRAMARAVSKNRPVLVELKAVDELYPFYGKLGIDPPRALADVLSQNGDGTFNVLAEASLLQRLDIKEGDLFQVGNARMRIGGVVTTEPDRTLRAFTLGPRLLLGRDALAATGLLQPGSLVTYGYRLRLAAGHSAEQVREELGAAFPEAGWRVRTWEKAAPRVRRVLDRMSLNLTLVGLCTLLVGGLGVAGAVRGYLRGKLYHIAVMKCVGATGRLVFAGYLLQVLILGAAGAAGGLAAGGALPWLLVKTAGRHLPIPLQPGFYPWPLVEAGLFGLLIALIFSLKALGTARRVPPAVLFRGYREDWWQSPGSGIWAAIVLASAGLALFAIFTSSDRRLALWFLSGAGACFATFYCLSKWIVYGAQRLPRPSRPRIRLALTNICRHDSPAGSTIFSLGLGLTALVMVVLVQVNLTRMVEETIPVEAPAFFFLDLQPDQVEEFESRVHSLPGVSRTERYPTLRGRIVAIKGVPVDQAIIAPDVQWAVRGDRFLSYAAQLPAGTALVAGKWWPADYEGPLLLSITEDIARGFGVRVGDTLTVNILGRNLTAEIASLRQVDWSTLALNFALLFSPGALEKAPQTFIATVYVPPGGENEVLREVTNRFGNISAIGVREVLANVSRTLGRIGGVFRAVTVLVLISGFLVLAGAISSDQHRRIHDAVICKVCGATRRDLLAAFGLEFLFLGLAAGLVSAAAGSWAAFGILEGLMGTEFRFSPGAVLATLAIGIVATLVLGLLGTWRGLGQKPAVFLRDE